MKAMKKILLAVLLLCVGLLLLTACEEEPAATTVMYTVTYDTGGGSPVEPMTVAEGATLLRPADPTRESYIFDGWLTEDGELWLFETAAVRSDMTLVASWRSAASVFDYELIEGKNEARLTRLKQKSATVTVPDSINGYPVTTLGTGLLANLSYEDVNAIVVPESVTCVEAEAFMGCVDIRILVKGELTSVGERAFKNCNLLENVLFGEGLTAVASEAFLGSALTDVILPKSLVLIGEDAFSDCNALQTIVLHGTATEGALVVEDSAFRDCDRLATVFFYGDDVSRDALLGRVANGNAALTEATFCYYSESKPEGQGSYWYFRNGKPRIW